MLAKRLHEEWRARVVAAPISPVPSFAPGGLVLGAGTVLVPAAGPRRLQKMEGQEGRLLALLSAASGAAVSPAVLGHFERAAKCWQRGDDVLAAIHLAFSGLQLPEDEREAACRLFIADELMKAGASPRAILAALDLEASFIDGVEKLYNPLEPRVPTGEPHAGEWAKEGSALADISAEQAASLGRFALRFLGPLGTAAAVFGLLFVPSPNTMRVEGAVPGLPRGRYSWNRDETTLSLTYDGADGQPRTILARKGADGVFRDEKGNAIGRALPAGTVAFDERALPSVPTKDDEPRLCPDLGPDKESGKGGTTSGMWRKSSIRVRPMSRRHTATATRCATLKALQCRSTTASTPLA